MLNRVMAPFVIILLWATWGAPSAAAVVFPPDTTITAELPPDFVIDLAASRYDRSIYNTNGGARVTLQAMFNISDDYRSGLLAGTLDSLRKNGFKEARRRTVVIDGRDATLVEGDGIGAAPMITWLAFIPSMRRTHVVSLLLPGGLSEPAVRMRAEAILSSVRTRDPPGLFADRDRLPFRFTELPDLRLVAVLHGAAVLWSATNAKLSLQFAPATGQPMDPVAAARKLLETELAHIGRISISEPRQLSILGRDGVEVLGDVITSTGQITIRCVVWQTTSSVAPNLVAVGTARTQYFEKALADFEKVKDSVTTR